MAIPLRWMLITMLLLRMALGNGWAMQPMAAPQAPQDSANMSLPCHNVAAMDAFAPQAGDDGRGHATAGVHGHGAHCVLCFPALYQPLPLALAAVKHAPPASQESASARWLRAPDLRPPI